MFGWFLFALDMFDQIEWRGLVFQFFSSIVNGLDQIHVEHAQMLLF